jgi:hypothetical protein
VKSRLKAPGTKRLNLEYDGLLSNFGFRFNLRPYILGVTVLLLTCSYNDTEFIRVGRALPVCLRCTGVPVYLCTCVPVYLCTCVPPRSLVVTCSLASRVHVRLAITAVFRTAVRPNSRCVLLTLANLRLGGWGVHYEQTECVCAVQRPCLRDTT